jgi:glycine/D-amino acid oxidase-like deaminating enzyme
MQQNDYDIIIVGGGFYGCALALFLRTISARILVVEAGDGLLERASRVNQARIHTGFHYPRSFTTAMRSMHLHERFIREFRHAVVDDFDMLYAIAAQRSKVSAARFAKMFNAIGAPFGEAPPQLRRLFDPALVEQVFLCREFAFDWTALRDDLVKRMEHDQVPIRMNETVERLACEAERVVVHLAGGAAVTAGHVFNVTYANINNLLLRSGLDPLGMKHELAEVALVEPPSEFAGLAVTLMDGPFFSLMPYPAEQLYSLTHVRYTPHYSWVDASASLSPYQLSQRLPKVSRWRQMVQHAKAFLPCIEDVRYRHSLFDVKTVLVNNERNDGRPILLHRHAKAPRVYSVMGAKIDNIYDLFEALPQYDEIWRQAHTGLLVGGTSA